MQFPVKGFMALVLQILLLTTPPPVQNVKYCKGEEGGTGLGDSEAPVTCNMVGVGVGDGAGATLTVPVVVTQPSTAPRLEQSSAVARLSHARECVVKRPDEL